MVPQAPAPDRARHGPDEASKWVARFAKLVPTGGPVLDLAAGRGRHTRFFLKRGHPVLAVDRDIAALESIASPRLELLRADLEEGPWPLEGRRFAGVIVANYLHRPLLPAVIAAVPFAWIGILGVQGTFPLTTTAVLWALPSTALIAISILIQTSRWWRPRRER